jgi:hypothetical protein
MRIEGPFHAGSNMRWASSGSYSLYAEVDDGVIFRWVGILPSDTSYDLYKKHNHAAARLWVRYKGETLYLARGTYCSWTRQEDVDEYIKQHRVGGEVNHFL